MSIPEMLGYICSRKVDQRLLRISTPLEHLHATDVPSPTNAKKEGQKNNMKHAKSGELLPLPAFNRNNLLLRS